MLNCVQISSAIWSNLTHISKHTIINKFVMNLARKRHKMLPFKTCTPTEDLPESVPLLMQTRFRKLLCKILY